MIFSRCEFLLYHRLSLWTAGSAQMDDIKKGNSYTWSWDLLSMCPWHRSRWIFICCCFGYFAPLWFKSYGLSP